MTLIQHKAKSKNFAWQEVILKLSTIEGDLYPYQITAYGGKNNMHVSVHESIDEALEVMHQLRDEVVA